MAELDPVAIGAFLADAIGDPTLSVTAATRLSGGASRETFSIELEGGALGPSVILQRVRAGTLSSTFSMEGEAALIAAARTAGVAVPEVVAATDDSTVIGAPFMVVSRVPGETIARKILRDDDLATGRTLLTRHCGAALALIHSLPLEAGPHLRESDPVESLVTLLDSLGEPHPAFELGIRWLEANRPTPVEPAVVHGDFRLGNLIVGDDGLRAVLDWELAHTGDPIEDLGWLCVRAWRFGGDAPVAGLGSYDGLCDAYEAAGGAPVDRERLRWWEVLGTMKWGIICILQASTHLLGMSRSVELAAIGRRVCENEHDLLDLLGVPAGDPLAPPVPAGEVPLLPPHDRPSAAQLVEAVREYLERDVMGATTGRVQFHARVAAKALAIVERELALGPAAAATHRAGLARLGFADDAELAAAIRSGAVDERLDEIGAAVRTAVDAKLAVANPDYA